MPIFLTKDGLPIAEGFSRLVIGGRGAYLEFDLEHLITSNFYMPKNQQWRIGHQYAYYLEYRSKKNFVKLYYQRRTVNYADYKVKKFYISPDDLYI
jgi:hypothetical protein